MADIDTMLVEVKRLDAEATPGEWQWFGNTDSQSCYLATTTRGRMFVLDFARWGMQSAQPRFCWPPNGHGDAGHMYDLAKLPVEAGPRFEASYRRDFVGINHPDAQLIAHYRTAAPLLAAEVERLRAELDQLDRVNAEIGADRDRLQAIVTASEREADRLRHGEPLESDFICPDSLEASAFRALQVARPLEDWSEGVGPALWWRFPINEPPYVGSPLDDDFPSYVTHWTSIVIPETPT